MNDYERGQWEALNRVLSLLQTYHSNTLDRKDLYATIFELRPTADQGVTQLYNEELEQEMNEWISNLKNPAQ